MKRMIIIAHPDDEFIGMGGSLIKFYEQNDEITIICCTDIDDGRLEYLQKLCDTYNFTLVPLHFSNALNLSDSNITELADALSVSLNTVQPEYVYTHTDSDIHLDHQIINKAVLLACRPKTDSSVNAIFTFKILDSNIWNFKNEFKANYFSILTADQVRQKIEILMQYYKITPVDKLNPRSSSNMLNECQYIGSKISTKFAEEFQIIYIKE